jgi:hypothetical protein
LTIVEQALFGATGGALVALGHWHAHLQRLSKGASPPTRFLFWSSIFFWAAFIPISAVASLACKPHSELLAMYEGASVPALLFVIAREDYK